MPAAQNYIAPESNVNASEAKAAPRDFDAFQEFFAGSGVCFAPERMLIF